jgi:hypothetical protein
MGPRNTKVIQEEMNLTQKELPAARGAQPVPRIREATTWLKLTRAPSGYAVDFLEARDRLPVGIEGTSQEFEMNRIAKEAAAHRLLAVTRMDRLEESIYWLLAAATIVYLLLGIISR